MFNIVKLFKGIGRKLAQTFGIIKKVVPEEILVHGIELAAEATTRFVDNAARRAWVIAQLQATFHISEGIARLVVELAVQHLKADVVKPAESAAVDAITS